jgi:hypothetical protein
VELLDRVNLESLPRWLTVFIICFVTVGGNGRRDNMDVD